MRFQFRTYRFLCIPYFLKSVTHSIEVAVTLINFLGDLLQ